MTNSRAFYPFATYLWRPLPPAHTYSYRPCQSLVNHLSDLASSCQRASIVLSFSFFSLSFKQSQPRLIDASHISKPCSTNPSDQLTIRRRAWEYFTQSWPKQYFA